MSRCRCCGSPFGCGQKFTIDRPAPMGKITPEHRLWEPLQAALSRIERMKRSGAIGPDGAAPLHPEAP